LGFDTAEFIPEITMQDEVTAAQTSLERNLYSSACNPVNTRHFSCVQVADAAGFSEGWSATSGVCKSLARAIPLHLQHASTVFGEAVTTFHYVDCR
jgi:hypothetical protein